MGANVCDILKRTATLVYNSKFNMLWYN